MIEQLFFELIRVSIGTQSSLSRVPSAQEWKMLYDMARKQSLVGICFAGVQKLCDSEKENYCGMNELLYFTWVGMAAKIQQKNEHHRVFIGKLAQFYEKEGLGMMLLKGYGLSALYTSTSSEQTDNVNFGRLRNPGDVDVFLFPIDNDAEMPAWKRGDMAIEEKLGVKVRNDSEHHTKFMIDDISVENHYDFVNTRIRRSSQRLEKVFKALAEEHSKWMEIDGQRVYLPSDALNGIFLLRHAAGHFASEGITMKNVIDWGMFVQSAKDLDWGWLWKMAHEYNMHQFLGCMNAICIEELGISASKFVQQDIDKNLKERVLAEIMNGTDLVPDASTLERTKRWWQHRWKHKICYSDSMVSSFVYSVKANLTGTSVE